MSDEELLDLIDKEDEEEHSDEDNELLRKQIAEVFSCSATIGVAIYARKSATILILSVSFL